MELHDWSDEQEPASAFDLSDPGALWWLLDRYGHTNPTVLQAVLGQVFAMGASSAVLEYRYVDADWRSEHAQFYGGTFRRYPSVAHRLHFFLKPVPYDALTADRPAGFANYGYLGYVVLRPVPAAPVGRAFLAPPENLRNTLTCITTDTVNLLGEQLTVEGTAFMAQDAMLLRCAHATLWMTAYHHHRRFHSSRRLPGDIANAVPGLGAGRSIPSSGLDLHQMSGASETLGMPPVLYDVDELPEGETLQRLACRYLNSGLPVIAVAPQHAFILIGYRRELAGTDDEKLIFLRHDDELGPYQEVENFQDDEHGPWDHLLVPLPTKVYMTGEEAEAIGRDRLIAEIHADTSTQAQDLIQKIDAGNVAFRSTAVPSNEFKIGVTSRGVVEPYASVYRRVHLSRWVWVVEVIERQAREADQPCVLAEAVIDAKDHQRDMKVLLVRTPTRLRQWLPDSDKVITRSQLPTCPPLASVGLARS